MKPSFLPLLAALLLFFSTPVLMAQQRTHCGTDEYYLQALQHNAVIKANQQASSAAYRQFVEQASSSFKTANGARYVIPVVVHVMHHPNHAIGQFTNIPEARVHEQIAVLNQDFGRLAANAMGTGGADMQIHFKLAAKDPDGNCHTGIVRVPYDSTDFFNDLDSVMERKMKRLSHWPSDKYLNIYTVGHFFDPVLGVATFPWMTGTPSLDSLDGVVIDHNYFGLVNDPNYNLGCTTTHEVGHWLGLFHTFQGSCANNNCLTQGDEVCDTPPAVGPLYASLPCNNVDDCFTDVNDTTAQNPYRDTTLGGLGGQWRQIANYMDYSDDACMNKFTEGQLVRCHYYLQNQRATVWQEGNLQTTGLKGLLHNFDSVGATAGINGKVVAMVEWPEQKKLVIAGIFTEAGGLPCKGLVTWNGTKYDTLPNCPAFDGLSNQALCLAVYDGQLYVGGTFLFYNQFRYLARYSPATQQWSKVTTNAGIEGTGGAVRCMKVHDGRLYVGGDFGQVDGNTINANRVASWSNNVWEPLGSGNNNGLTGSSAACYAMATWKGKLVVGGRFSAAGGVRCDKVALWGGNSFTSLDSDTNDLTGRVNSLCAYKNKLYAGGTYFSIGGEITSAMCVYDSTKWRPTSKGVPGAHSIDAMEPFNGYIWAGGLIMDLDYSVDNIYTYDAATDTFNFITAINQGINGPIHCMAVFNNQLYIGGEFTGLDGPGGPFHNITRVNLYCPTGTVSVGPSTAYSSGHLRVYPNPGQNTVWVSNHTGGFIEVYNAWGKQVQRVSCSGRYAQMIDISALPAGMYVVVNGRQAVRLVKVDP